MNVNDNEAHFYSHFPSLNSNSKENIRHKRISNEYTNYLNSLKKDSDKPTKQQQRARSQRENASTSFASDTSTPTMDEIFSAEERNRFEDVQKEEKRRIYQQSLEEQIEEQRMKRKLEQEKKKKHELMLERTLQRQLENIRRERDPMYDKVVERVSLSENEKEVINNSRVSVHNSSLNNEVYRYFSHSAKTDSELFNYKRYFSDVLEPKFSSKHDFDSMPRDYTERPSQIIPRVEPHRSSELLKALKNAEFATPPKSPVIDTCQCQTQAKCSRCNKRLEMFCKECNERHDESLPEATNRRQIEYNEPELPFTANQQVVVFRPSEQNAPFSFNVDANSLFYKDALEQMQNFDEQKLVNYIKLYGDLRNRKLNLDRETQSRKVVPDKEDRLVPMKVTGTIPKDRPVKDSNKKIVLSPSKSSDLEDLISNAQYTVITQVGFARKQLELEKLKL